YFALSRTLPFADSSVARVLARTVRCKVHWPKEKFEQCSGGIIKLIKSLLAKDPAQRPSAATTFAAMWALLRPRERQTESVVQSLQAVPGRSSSKTRLSFSSSPCSTHRPSDQTPRAASPFRKMIETRQVRKTSRESVVKEAGHARGRVDSLQSFLRCKDSGCSGSGHPERDDSGGTRGTKTGSRGPERPKQKTGFIRRRMNDFFQRIQRIDQHGAHPKLYDRDTGLAAEGNAFGSVVPLPANQPAVLETADRRHTLR
ncbi:unnamed protein product, partial [Durusdinium trenchii]